MAPEPSQQVHVHAWGRRRSALVLAGCSLVAIGLGLHAVRHYAIAPEELPWVDVPLATDQRFVAYMMQPDVESDDEDEAGGTERRHPGMQGRMGRPPSSGKARAAKQRAKEPDELGEIGRPQGRVVMISNQPAPAPVLKKPKPRPRPEPEPVPAELYREWIDHELVKTVVDRVSTFSIDVDTGSYAVMRKDVGVKRVLPAASTVRIEEMINYFDYDYSEPTDTDPVAITSEVGPCPWDDALRLVHIGVQAKHIAPATIAPRNLVFLVDVSGSMSEELPLVVSSLAFLAERLGERDRISIVVYAGAAGVVLEPTAGSDKARILGALDRLEAGGGTNGGEGIHAAYALAQKHFVEGGINRVVLATDGDFNLGVSDHDALVDLIETKRESGVFLSVLGFGGANYQDDAMEQLADKGNGNYAYIDGLAEARKVLVEEAESTLVTLAKDVKIQVELDPKLVKRYRLIGYSNRVLADDDFANDKKDAGEIGAGHTVTALYEIEPTQRAAGGDPLMNVQLRYKEPAAKTSKLMHATVSDEGADLRATSDDFRFAAAVAWFGQTLQELPSKTELETLAPLRDLALQARGDDPTCRRGELVGLIERASELRGDPIAPAALGCTPAPQRPPLVSAPVTVISAMPALPAIERENEHSFVLEVLTLVPPIMAVPLFVMALWRPRRAAVTRSREMA